MRKIYHVDLKVEEEQRLNDLIGKGVSSARKIRRARSLLLAFAGWSDAAIAQALQAGENTVARTRRRFVEEGLEACLGERARPGAQRKLDGKQEAFVVALACSEPPVGRAHWTMQLLADKMVALGQVESLDDNTVQRTLKKTLLNRGSRNVGASPQ